MGHLGVRQLLAQDCHHIKGPTNRFGTQRSRPRSLPALPGTSSGSRLLLVPTVARQRAFFFLAISYFPGCANSAVVCCLVPLVFSSSIRIRLVALVGGQFGSLFDQVACVCNVMHLPNFLRSQFVILLFSVISPGFPVSPSPCVLSMFQIHAAQQISHLVVGLFSSFLSDFLPQFLFFQSFIGLF